MPAAKLPSAIRKKYNLPNRDCWEVQLLGTPDPEGEFEVFLDFEVTVESGNLQQVLICTPEGKIIFKHRPARGLDRYTDDLAYAKYKTRILRRSGKEKVLRKTQFLYVAAFSRGNRGWISNRVVVGQQSRNLKVAATRKAILRTEDSPRRVDRDGDDAVVVLEWVVLPRQISQPAAGRKRKASASKK